MESHFLFSAGNYLKSKDSLVSGHSGRVSRKWESSGLHRSLTLGIHLLANTHSDDVASQHCQALPIRRALWSTLAALPQLILNITAIPWACYIMLF